MEQVFLLPICIFLLVAGAIVAAALSRHERACGWFSLGFVSAASAGLILLSLGVFLNGPMEKDWFSLHPLIGSSLRVGVDSLSALFLFILAVVLFCATLFSIRYIGHYKKESLIRYYPILLLFFASMVGVVSVTDMMFFIVFWEIMTLTSWALVIYERENRESLKAGLIYFIVTHLATGFLILGAVILYSNTPGPSFGFDAFRDSLESLLSTQPALVHFVLALFVVGFVTKASSLPFGFWLPLAHPVAPSSFSAVLSGVMIKAGLYGMARLFFSILPISSLTQIWGVLIALLGAFSLFVGTMSALAQDDSKRLMAFHSIGQVGYMLLGLGLGLYFLPLNPSLGTIALVGGLFHMINHCWFKSCLFLNAGSLLYRTGTRDLNKIGGLFHLLPWTGITALIASLSISGIPPFNGFASKLLIFEASILSGKEAGAGLGARGLFVILGLAAVFISAVTLASFLKFMNSAFMGKLRGLEEGLNVDVPLSMKIPQGILAFLCVLFGVIPVLPTTMVYEAIRGALPGGICPPFHSLFGKGWLGIHVDLGMGLSSGIWNPWGMIVASGIVLGILLLVVRAGGAKVRRVETWYGGREHFPADISYRGHSFYMPFKKVFSFQIRNIRFQGLYPTTFPLPRIAMPQGLKALLHPDHWFYDPLGGLFVRVTRFLRRSHTGIPQMYLLWIAAGVILVMVLLLSLSGE